MEAVIATEPEDFEFVAVKQENMEDSEADEQDPLQEFEFVAVKQEQFEVDKIDDMKQLQVQHSPYTSCSTSRKAEDSPGHRKGHTDSDFYELVPCRSSLSEDCKGSLRYCAGTQEDVISQLYTCSLCLNLFSSKYSLINHVFTHMDGIQPPQHICRLCGEVFHSAASVSEHLVQRKWRSPPVSTQPTSVSISEFFTSPQETTDCKKLHDAEKASCNVCGKIFARFSSLNVHKRIHTGEKPYSCKFCERPFSSSTYLTYHIRTHTQERPHTCELCGKSFIRPGALKVHKRTHTREKPHSCNLCGRPFSDVCNLYRHMRTHIGKPYSCEVCFRLYSSSTSLKYHTCKPSQDRPHACEFSDNTFDDLSVRKDQIRRTYAKGKP